MKYSNGGRSSHAQLIYYILLGVNDIIDNEKIAYITWDRLSNNVMVILSDHLLGDIGSHKHTGTAKNSLYSQNSFYPVGH